MRWQYDCSLAKVDWLDACVALRVVGAVLVEIHFFHYIIVRAAKKFKNWPRLLFRPRTDHAFSQKQNPSRKTVPLIRGNISRLFH